MGNTSNRARVPQQTETPESHRQWPGPRLRRRSVFDFNGNVSTLTKGIVNMAEERVTRFDMNMIRSILTTMTNEIVKNNKEIQQTRQSASPKSKNTKRHP